MKGAGPFGPAPSHGTVATGASPAGRTLHGRLEFRPIS